MHAQSSILGTALLVSAAMAAPVAQITTTVSEPIAGWGGATISNTAINPQAGDWIPPFGGFGYNPYRSWEGKYDGECSIFRRYRGECSLDQPSWNSPWNNNNWYDRSVNAGQDSAITSETTISKRDTAEASTSADAASSADASQWGPVYGGWGYGGYRPRTYGWRSYNPYAYRYNPYSYYGSSIYGGYPSYYPYYRATDEAAKDATAENAGLEAAPAAADATAATEATTTVQNSKRDLSKRQWGPAWGPIGSPLYFQWLNWINTLRSGNVGSASFGGINPSFTVDSGLPSYGGSYPGAYAGAYPVGFVPVPYASSGVATGVGAAAVPGLVGTFSVENSNTKQ